MAVKQVLLSLLLLLFKDVDGILGTGRREWRNRTGEVWCCAVLWQSSSWNSALQSVLQSRLQQPDIPRLPRRWSAEVTAAAAAELCLFLPGKARATYCRNLPRVFHSSQETFLDGSLLSSDVSSRALARNEGLDVPSVNWVFSSAVLFGRSLVLPDAVNNSYGWDRDWKPVLLDKSPTL